MTTGGSDRQAAAPLALTMGDVAGIGPELILGAWRRAEFHELAPMLVIGSRAALAGLATAMPGAPRIVSIRDPAEARPSPELLPCLEGSDVRVEGLARGRVHAAAGQAARDYLVTGIDLALERRLMGLVTLPLHKGGLRAAGLDYPGHTEILAERTGVARHAMMLYRRGLGVIHVTLHLALRDVFARLSPERILDAIELLDGMLRRLDPGRPKIGVAALNPHASDGGLFGLEEAELIEPAVRAALSRGLDASGPHPADTLFSQAAAGAFSGVVAMYHDQGHIALKLLGWREAVNITVGLPIVRVSVAHGTAYDIVGTGMADPTSLIEAVAVAARLSRTAMDD